MVHLCLAAHRPRAKNKARDVTFPLHRNRQGGDGIEFPSASLQNKAGLNYSFRLDIKNRTLSLAISAGEQVATINGQHHNACFLSADSFKTRKFCSSRVVFKIEQEHACRTLEIRRGCDLRIAREDVIASTTQFHLSMVSEQHERGEKHI
jgi:hypothetical protein